MSESSFNIAGILVRTHPDNLSAVTAALSELPGIEVHHEESETGRVVVTCETPTVAEQHDGLMQIRRQAGVISADPVYHYVAPPEIPDGPDAPPTSGTSS